MSATAIQWAFNVSLKPTEKLVLVALCSHINNNELEKSGDNHCWPSVTRLQNETGLSRPSVWKSINKLIEKGLVSRCGIGPSGSTYYEIKVGNQVNKVGKEINKVGNQVNNKVGNQVNKVGKEINTLGNHVTSEQERTGKNKKNTESRSHAHGRKSFGEMTPIPDDFNVTEQHRLWAKTTGAPKPETCIEKFIAHHQSKGTLSCDWNAEFRKWLINERVFSTKGLSPAQSRAIDEPRRPRRDLLEGYVEPKPLPKGFSIKKIMQEEAMAKAASEGKVSHG